MLGDRIRLASPRRDVWISATSCCLAGFLSLYGPSVRATDSWVARYPEVRRETNAACQQQMLRACESGLEQLLSMVDGRPDLRCLLSSVQARLGEQDAALASLAICVRSGLDFGAMLSAPALQALRSLPGYEAVVAKEKRKAPGNARYQVSHSLLDPDLLAEDLAYNPSDDSFLISSVHERKILRMAANGTIEDFVTMRQVPMWGVFALALDTGRQILWATTTAVPQAPPFSAAEDGRSAVLRIDLRSRALLGRYELTDGKAHAFGDMTLASDGAAFVADGSGGGVYVIRPGKADPFETVVAAGILESPQTPALSPDGRTLLVPDYTRGIVRVDLRTHEVRWLTHPVELAAYGIDGFYWRGRTLVGIQNGTTPERIVLFRLDADGSHLGDWRVALANAAGLGDPTHGVVRGSYFYFLANSGWDRMGDDGQFKKEAPASPPQIWRLRLPIEE